MKRNGLFFLLLFVASISLTAKSEYKTNHIQILQDSLNTNLVEKDSLQHTQSASALLDADGNTIDTSKVKLPNTYAWVISPRLGERTLVPMDTVRENFHRSILTEGAGMAMSYTGNIGGPVQSKEFFARKEPSDFIWMDAYEMWRKSPEKQLFLNTKAPYSNVQYQAGGGKEVAENRFKAELASNFGKRLNVGFNFDYIYARGHYNALFNKQTSYDVNASYIGDRYKMHLFIGNNNLNASDNGGITDDRYITNSEAENLKNIQGNTRNIPTVYRDGLKNKLRGRHIYLTNRYDIGRDTELVQVNDSTSTWRKKKNYISPASVILTTHYTDQRRRFTSSEYDVDLNMFNTIYEPNFVDANGNPLVDKNGNGIPLYDGRVNDYMSYYSLKNTLAFSMNEGFKSWTKFGLTAFVEYEMRRFLLPNAEKQYFSDEESDDMLSFGGKLSKSQGQFLKYNLNALKGLNTSDLELDADVTTHFGLLGKDVSVKAMGYIKNIAPNFTQQNFTSRNWSFRDKNFNDTKKVYVGAEIFFPKLSFSETSISGGYENISDYIYWGADRKPTQYTGNVNVLALKINQKFNAGIFHFDVSALYQKTSKDDVIPLPELTAYANVYLQTMVSKVLTVQIGVDGYAHTKYYAPGYDPLQIQFYNQKEVKLGNFPHANAYINLHLKYTRFFIMMYNLADGMGNGQSFTTPHYPVNPRMLRWGLSWKFNN